MSAQKVRVKSLSLTFARTVGADWLHLLYHTGAKLSHCNLHAGASAGSAWLHSTWLATLPVNTDQSVTQNELLQTNCHNHTYNSSWPT